MVPRMPSAFHVTVRAVHSANSDKKAIKSLRRVQKRAARDKAVDKALLKTKS